MTLSRLISITLNKTIDQYTKNLFKDLINFIFIFRYINFINNYEASTRLEYLYKKSSTSDIIFKKMYNIIK